MLGEFTVYRFFNAQTLGNPIRLFCIYKYMNKYLAYQFVGRSDGMQQIPEHIQVIKKKLGFEEREKQLVEELIPQLRRRIRAQSIPEKQLPRQAQMNLISKKISSLRQDYDKVNWELQKFQSFRNTIKNPKTAFEQHFSQIESQVQQMEEQRSRLQQQIKLLKKEMFKLETQQDTYTSKKVVSNQSVLLSELVTIEKKLQSPKNLPKIEKKSYKNTNETQNVIDFMESENEEDFRPRTKAGNPQNKLPTLEQIIDQLDQILIKPDDKLLSGKEALVLFRKAKYEKYLRQPRSNRRIKNIKYCFISVVFCICLIKATKISQQRYQLICHEFQRSNFDKCNQEILFFVNNVIAKQILFQFSRLQQLQKLEKKKIKTQIPGLAEEIVREIIQKLTVQKFSKSFYNFVISVSDEGYHSLQNFHCEFFRSKQTYSKYFSYYLKECRRMVLMEFIILKNILFYGLFYKTKELFTQLKIDIDNELINTVSLIIFELMLRTYATSVMNVNLKHLANPHNDGPNVMQFLRELELAKMKLISNLVIDDLLRPFVFMLERQMQCFQSY